MAVNGTMAKAIAGSVWLNQGQYEATEAMAHETVAKQHSGLKIEVFLHGISKCKHVFRVLALRSLV